MSEVTYRCDLCHMAIVGDTKGLLGGVALYWETRPSTRGSYNPSELAGDRAVARPLGDRDSERHICFSCIHDITLINQKGDHLR